MNAVYDGLDDIKKENIRTSNAILKVPMSFAGEDQEKREERQRTPYK